MSKVLSKHPKVDEWERDGDGYFIDMKTATTKTRTVGGIKWECSESEGLWFAGEYRIGRCDRKGQKRSWELFKNNESKWIAGSCGDLMDMVARKQI